MSLLHATYFAFDFLQAARGPHIQYFRWHWAGVFNLLHFPAARDKGHASLRILKKEAKIEIKYKLLLQHTRITFFLYTNKRHGHRCMYDKYMQQLHTCGGWFPS